MAIVEMGVEKAHLLAFLVHQIDEMIRIAFIRVAQELIVPSIFIGIDLFVPQFDIVNQPNDLTYGNGSVVSAGEHQCVKKFLYGVNLPKLKSSRRASNHQRRFSYLISNSFGVVIEFV